MIETQQMKETVHAQEREFDRGAVAKLDPLPLGCRPGNHNVPEIALCIARGKAQDVGPVVLSEELLVESLQLTVATETKGQAPVPIRQAGREGRVAGSGFDGRSDLRRWDRNSHGLDYRDLFCHSWRPIKPAISAIII